MHDWKHSYNCDNGDDLSFWGSLLAYCLEPGELLTESAEGASLIERPSFSFIGDDSRAQVSLPFYNWETKRLLVWINALPAGRFHCFPKDVIFGSTSQLVNLMLEFKRKYLPYHPGDNMIAARGSTGDGQFLHQAGWLFYWKKHTHHLRLTATQTPLEPESRKNLHDSINTYSLLWFEMSDGGSAGVNQLIDASGSKVDPSGPIPPTDFKPDHPIEVPETPWAETPFRTPASAPAEPPTESIGVSERFLWMDDGETLPPPAVDSLNETSLLGPLFGVGDPPDFMPGFVLSVGRTVVPVMDPPTPANLQPPVAAPTEEPEQVPMTDSESVPYQPLTSLGVDNEIRPVTESVETVPVQLDENVEMIPGTTATMVTAPELIPTVQDPTEVIPVVPDITASTSQLAPAPTEMSATDVDGFAGPGANAETAQIQLDVVPVLVPPPGGTEQIAVPQPTEVIQLPEPPELIPMPKQQTDSSQQDELIPIPDAPGQQTMTPSGALEQVPVQDLMAKDLLRPKRAKPASPDTEGFFPI